MDRDIGTTDLRATVAATVETNDGMTGTGTVGPEVAAGLPREIETAIGMSTADSQATDMVTEEVTTETRMHGVAVIGLC